MLGGHHAAASLAPLADSVAPPDVGYAADGAGTGGARWNGWGAFLSSSKRNTLWEKESSQLYTVEMPYYY